jgi:predicted secreted hydrolase
MIILILLSHSFSFGQDYFDVTEDSVLKFPDAFYYQKDYRVQWWYFTGHLFDESGREFGYELTFFVVNVQKRDYRSRFGVNRIFISHFAVSDVSGNIFHFSDKSDIGAYGFAGAENNRLRVWIEDNLLDGSTEKMRLKASDGEKAMDLDLVPVKPIVLNGEKGYSRKSEESPLIASLYFSYPQMNTAGRLTLGGKVFRVKGKTWFDREISTRELSPHQTGWDWFAIQLDDNREIMLYVMRNKDGSVDRYSSGTFVYPDGKYRRLSKDKFSVDVLSYYNSRKTGARYPSQWEIRIPSEKLMVRITPLIQDQEVLAYSSTGNHYWEGTCRVEGTARGRAYVEMTGY